MDWVIESYRDDEFAVSANLATKAWSLYEPITAVFNPDLFGFLWTMPGIERDLLLCAKHKGKAVGQVLTLPRTVKLGDQTFKIGAVAYVAVHPDFRRKQIAKSLLEKTIEAASEKGFDGLTLFTDLSYPLYEKIGFKTFYENAFLMKVLDPWFVAKALGKSYLAPLMWLKSRVKEKTLPEGFVLRDYENKDRYNCVNLVKEHIEQFEYVELVSEDFWVWWHEVMPKAVKPKTFVLERNGELIGTILCYTQDVKAKGKWGEKEFPLGITGTFCYKRGYENEASSLIWRALNELKRLGVPAVTNFFSPNFFQPTDFLKKIWGKQGFVRQPGREQRYMYKSLNSKFGGLESLNTFFIQPF